MRPKFSSKGKVSSDLRSKNEEGWTLALEHTPSRRAWVGLFYRVLVPGDGANFLWLGRRGHRQALLCCLWVQDPVPGAASLHTAHCCHLELSVPWLLHTLSWGVGTAIKCQELWSHLCCFPEEKLQITERFAEAVSQECPLLPKVLSLAFGGWWWGAAGGGGVVSSLKCYVPTEWTPVASGQNGWRDHKWSPFHPGVSRSCQLMVCQVFRS